MISARHLSRDLDRTRSLTLLGLFTLPPLQFNFVLCHRFFFSSTKFWPVLGAHNAYSKGNHSLPPIAIELLSTYMSLWLVQKQISIFAISTASKCRPPASKHAPVSSKNFYWHTINLSFWNTDCLSSKQSISVLAKSVDCLHFIPLSKFPNHSFHAQIHFKGRNICFFEKKTVLLILRTVTEPRGDVNETWLLWCHRLLFWFFTPLFNINMHEVKKKGVVK